MSSKLSEVYQAVLHAAEADPNVLGFILCGSRGKGFVTENSDFDCAIVVSEDAYESWVASMSELPPGLDVAIYTLQSFAEHAEWGGFDRGYRYDWAHLRAQVDKTGGLLQQLIDEKGKVPETEVEGFIKRSLDHYINQVYRSIKCLRDGNRIGYRLEAADSIKPLLDAVFALHQRRLRPYYKYLHWELREFPLAHLRWSADQFVEMLLAILTDGSCAIQQEILRWVIVTFRAHGFAEVFEAWGSDLWIADYPPEAHELGL